MPLLAKPVIIGLAHTVQHQPVTSHIRCPTTKPRCATFESLSFTSVKCIFLCSIQVIWFSSSTKSWLRKLLYLRSQGRHHKHLRCASVSVHLFLICFLNQGWRGLHATPSKHRLSQTPRATPGVSIGSTKKSLKKFDSFSALTRARSGIAFHLLFLSWFSPPYDRFPASRLFENKIGGHAMGRPYTCRGL